jgi:uncharacterized protein (TIGR03067 family)
MKRCIFLAAMILLALWSGPGVGGGRKEKFDPDKVRKLQATLPAGWKDDGTILDVRRFFKDGKEKLSVFAILYRDEAPKSAVALADLAKKDPNLFPHRIWIKTTGIGKLPDGFFIVGQGKALGFETDTIGAVRTIEGKTVLFMCVPATEAAARKEMLGVVRSATFGGAAAPGDAKSSGKLDGKWQVVRQEEHGGLVPAIVSKRLSMLIDGNKMEWYIGNPAPNFAATITVDEGKKTVDARITRGSFIGKTMLGIYKLERNVLHMCWGEIGTDKRPERFATTKRGGGVYNYTIYSRGPVSPEAPPDPTKKQPPAGKRPKLADLKFTVPKGWEAKYSDIVEWKISHGGFAPSIVAHWVLPRDYPKDLDDYVKRLQKDGDHFGYGIYWTSVTQKGELPDGLYVVGKIKVGKTGKEGKHIAFSIIRDFGGYKLIFESFSTDYNDARLLREAMDICKSAKF